MAVGAAVVQGSRACPGAARASAVGCFRQLTLLQTRRLLVLVAFFLAGFAFQMDQPDDLCHTNASASARGGHFAGAKAEG